MRSRRHWKTAAVLATAVSTVVLGSTLANADPGDHPLPPSPARYAQAHGNHAAAGTQATTADGRTEGDSGEIADRAEEYANQRIAPGTSVPAAAISTARADGNALPAVGGLWSEVTGQAYQSEPTGYSDPIESNAGAGEGLVGGRTTALATDGYWVFAGAADGGVWRTPNGGRQWLPSDNGLGSESIGALLVDHGGALWAGTGEANTNSDSYQGQGVYVSYNHGATFSKVGGAELDGGQIFRLVQSEDGTVFAATTHGLWRHDASTNGAWQQVFAPDPNPGNSPYRTNFVTDVQVRPGTNGQVVLASIGWRGGTSASDLSYNGFYVSTSGGAPGSFAKVGLTGAINASDMGRSTFKWSADGQRLWAIVESPANLAAGKDTSLQGVFVSKTGDPAGPWTLAADSAKLGASGSALQNLSGYHVGIQSWYNQALAVDPGNHDHVYVSLEEVFETTDGGNTFQVGGPYWNYGLSCGTSCPPTTHPDQHALAVVGDRIFTGSDGGVWNRPLSAHGLGNWTDTNATLHSLQYYGAGTGALPGGGLAYWGGLQDNGTSVLNGLGARQNIEPAGGDGGNVLVDPANGANSVGEYTNLAMYLTTDGGHNFRTISPVCGGNPDEGSSFPGCDPAARFIAPFVADVNDPNHWVAGGEYVWDDTKAYATHCHADGCDWRNVHDLGTGVNGSRNLTTALAVNGSTTYAGWVGGGGNPGPAFASGIDTNYGGTWHRVTAPNLPQRYLAGLTVDPANPAHVYAVYSGYSRRWIPGGGVGHVFESSDGGDTWADISGNLPDTSGDNLVIAHGKLAVATDTNVFVTSAANPGSWSRLGTGLPMTSVNQLSVTPDGNTIVAATHGRGIWQLPVP